MYVTLKKSSRSSFCGCYFSEVEPKKVEESLDDESWVNTMYEGLHQFIRNDVWELIPRPENYNILGTKWFFKNKVIEHGTTVKSKARLVAQATHNWRRLILMKLLLRLLIQNLSAFFLQLLIIQTSNYIKQILWVHFSMDFYVERHIGTTQNLC